MPDQVRCVLISFVLIFSACGGSNTPTGSDAAIDQPVVGDQAIADRGIDDGPVVDFTVDGEARDVGCHAESDVQFCSRARARCGLLTAKDNCGQSRTASCGSCAAPLTCGGAGKANVCGFGNPNWTTQIVDSQGDVGRKVAIALDDTGVPHVAYQDTTTSMALKYALLQGGSWVTSVVDAGSLVAEYLDIAIAPAGTIFLAARRVGKPTLWTRAAPWTQDTIHPYGGRYISLALDTAGKAHICHTDSKGELLFHSLQDNSGWKTETIHGKVLSGQRLGDYCSIAVDATGGVHVSYDNLNWLSLGYAYKPIGGTWSNEVVDKDPKGKVGGYTSIALDSGGKPFIAYFRSVDDTIALAHKGAGAWTSETVDTTGVIAAHTSLALDSANSPHLSYFDSNLGAMRYAHKGATSWKIETIAVVGTGTGGYNDIAVDSAGKAHIVFYNAADKRLEYAKQK